MPSTSHSRVAALVTVVLVAVLGSQAIAPAAGSDTQRTTAFSATTHEQPRATMIHRVSPVDRSGQVQRNYRVTLTRRGSCWTYSFVHPELYRCVRGNYIHDPCWRGARRSQPTVICLGLPWSHQLTRLRLTERLPHTSSGRAGVWGLTLPRGVDCLFAQGASGFVHGHHISYFCRRRWVLLDEPDRGRIWHIRTARRSHGHYELRPKRPLTDAWFAKQVS